MVRQKAAEQLDQLVCAHRLELEPAPLTPVQHSVHSDVRDLSWVHWEKVLDSSSSLYTVCGVPAPAMHIMIGNVSPRNVVRPSSGRPDGPSPLWLGFKEKSSWPHAVSSKRADRLARSASASESSTCAARERKSALAASAIRKAKSWARWRSHPCSSRLSPLRPNVYADRMSTSISPSSAPNTAQLEIQPSMTVHAASRRCRIAKMARFVPAIA